MISLYTIYSFYTPIPNHSYSYSELLLCSCSYSHSHSHSRSYCCYCHSNCYCSCCCCCCYQGLTSCELRCHSNRALLEEASFLASNVLFIRISIMYHCHHS